MARKKQSRGNCAFCDKEMSRGGLSRHLKSCAQRQQAQAAASGRVQNLYHLLVQDAWYGDYWLHLEMKGSAALSELDHYLRAIWLECCGHLSGFNIGQIFYTQIFNHGFGFREEKPMTVKVSRIFSPGLIIPYEYDFGTTSELKISVLDVREGKPLSPHPIFLMARNKMEPVFCMKCGQPATQMCIQCLYEREDDRFHLCEEHGRVHECWDYGGTMPVLNSPRTGLCGYTGPAEPPY